MIITITNTQQETAINFVEATKLKTATTIARATSPAAIATYKTVITFSAIAVALVTIAIAVTGYKTGQLARTLCEAYSEENNRSAFVAAVSEATQAEVARYQPVADVARVVYGIGYVLASVAIAMTQAFTTRVARVASEVMATLPMGFVTVQ